MELKTKYQYSYFFYPYMVEEKKYEKYLLKLLMDKNCKIKMYDKEKHNNLYTYFLPSVRDYMFPSFEYNKEKVLKYEDMDKQLKSIMLAKNNCTIFEYNIDDSIQGKINDEENIFFKIQKIQIICFNTGVCFLSFKTHLEDSDKFSDVLNFNYKFRDINSDFKHLKEYENINIQTDAFSGIESLPKFIANITGVTKKSEKLELDDKFFTYSYTCIEQENWNDKKDFEEIENDFFKYANILPMGYNSSFSKKELETQIDVVGSLKYVKYGVSQVGSVLFTSTADTYNYTKLPVMYENEYLYSTIIALHQKIYLNVLSKKFNSKTKVLINKTRKNFAKFVKLIWKQEITNQAEGMEIYSKIRNKIGLNSKYNEVKNKYEIIFNEMEIKETNKINKIVIMVLLASILLNIVNAMFVIFRR